MSFWHSPSLCPAGESREPSASLSHWPICALKQSPRQPLWLRGTSWHHASHCKHWGHVGHWPSQPSPAGIGLPRRAIPHRTDAARAPACPGRGSPGHCGHLGSPTPMAVMASKLCTAPGEGLGVTACHSQSRSGGRSPSASAQPRLPGGCMAWGQNPVQGGGARHPGAHPCSTGPAPAACRSCCAGRCRSRRYPTSGSCNASPCRPAGRPRPAPTASSSLFGEG